MIYVLLILSEEKLRVQLLLILLSFYRNPLYTWLSKLSLDLLLRMPLLFLLIWIFNLHSICQFLNPRHLLYMELLLSRFLSIFNECVILVLQRHFLFGDPKRPIDGTEVVISDVWFIIILKVILIVAFRRSALLRGITLFAWVYERYESFVVVLSCQRMAHTAVPVVNLIYVEYLVLLNDRKGLLRYVLVEGEEVYVLVVYNSFRLSVICDEVRLGFGVVWMFYQSLICLLSFFYFCEVLSWKIVHFYRHLLGIHLGGWLTLS